jgi:streptogramin lyase
MAVTAVEYPLASLDTQIYGVTPYPNGNVWFTATDPAEVGVFNPTSHLSEEFPLNIANSRPEGIVAGGDGNLYFADNGTNSIGVFNPFTFAKVEFPTPTPGSQPMGIARAADGTIWFTENAVGKVGKLDPTTHHITEYPLALSTSGSMGIIPGPDGDLWFTDLAAIGRIDPSTGVVTDTPAPGLPSAGLTVGPDQQIWFSYEAFEPPNSVRLGFAAINPSTLNITSYPTNQVYNDTSLSQEGFTTGPDGKLYFAELSKVGYNNSAIGEFDTTTHVLTYVYSPNPPGGTHGSLVYSIATGTDGGLYYGDTGAVGVLSIIPASQSVIHGQVRLALPPMNTSGALAGRTVFVDLNNDGRLDPGDPSAVTDALGFYQITGLPVASYKVRVVGYPGDFTTAASVTTIPGGISQEVVPTVQPSSAVLPLTFNLNPFGSTNPDLAVAEVNGLYNIILGRTPDFPGDVAFVSYLRNGGSLAVAADVMLHSTEYETDLVNLDYANYFGRIGTPGEVGGWVALMQHGDSAEQITTLMLSSDGFNALHPDSASFVQALYGDLLGRQGTSAEVAAWATYLATSNPNTVLSLFLHSPESYTRATEGFTAEFWAVAFGPAGEPLGIAALESGRTLADVASLFAASSVFIARAQAVA